MDEITYEEFITFLKVIIKAKRAKWGDTFADETDYRAMLNSPMDWLNHLNAEFSFVFGDNVKSISFDSEKKTINFVRF